jgi:hypothetical protein
VTRCVGIMSSIYVVLNNNGPGREAYTFYLLRTFLSVRLLHTKAK